MSGNGNQKRNFSRRNFRRRKRPKQSDSGLICTICNQPLRELHSAIANKDTNEPVHFDCVVKLLLKTEELEPTDKICYLGNGSFGIIAFRHSNSPIRFLIKKRIKFEEFEKIPEWRTKNKVQLQVIKSRSRPRSA